MKVIDYLNAKYGVGHSTILYAEAKALGIPYPTPKGWLTIHGQRAITPQMTERLRAALEKVKERKRSAADGLRVLNAWEAKQPEMPTVYPP